MNYDEVITSREMHSLVKNSPMSRKVISVGRDSRCAAAVKPIDTLTSEKCASPIYSVYQRRDSF